MPVLRKMRSSASKSRSITYTKKSATVEALHSLEQAQGYLGYGLSGFFYR
jgi:hypothetical protein